MEIHAPNQNDSEPSSKEVRPRPRLSRALGVISSIAISGAFLAGCSFEKSATPQESACETAAEAQIVDAFDHQGIHVDQHSITIGGCANAGTSAESVILDNAWLKLRSKKQPKCNIDFAVQHENGSTSWQVHELQGIPVSWAFKTKQPSKATIQQALTDHLGDFPKSQQQSLAPCRKA